jgi:hypothetical protein
MHPARTATEHALAACAAPVSLPGDQSEPFPADRDLRLVQQAMDLPVAPVVVLRRQAHDRSMSAVHTVAPMAVPACRSVETQPLAGSTFTDPVVAL